MGSPPMGRVEHMADGGGEARVREPTKGERDSNYGGAQPWINEGCIIGPNKQRQGVTQGFIPGARICGR